VQRMPGLQLLSFLIGLEVATLLHCLSEARHPEQMVLRNTTRLRDVATPSLRIAGIKYTMRPPTPHHLHMAFYIDNLHHAGKFSQENGDEVGRDNVQDNYLVTNL